MSDEFDFTQPERREPRGFEPPPWEQEAFEALQKRREQEHPAEQPAQPAADEVPASPAPAVAVNEDQAAAPAMAGNEDQAVAPAAAVNEGEVVAMLAELAAEEPSTQRSLETVAYVAAAVTGMFGVVLMIWGVVALAGSSASGRVGVIGGSLFFFFGLAALIFSAWLIVKTLRQRGVL